MYEGAWLKHNGLKKSQKMVGRGLRQICSVLHGPKKSSAGKTFKARQMPTGRTTRLAQRCGKTIKELGGTIPQDSPIPEKSIKQIEREMEKKKLK